MRSKLNLTIDFMILVVRTHISNLVGSLFSKDSNNDHTLKDYTQFKLYIDPIISFYVDAKIDLTVCLLSYEHLCLAGIVS